MTFVYGLLYTAISLAFRFVINMQSDTPQETTKSARLYKLEHDGQIEDLSVSLQSSNIVNLTKLLSVAPSLTPDIVAWFRKPQTIFRSSIAGSATRGDVLYFQSNSWLDIRTRYPWFDSLPFIVRQLRYSLCWRVIVSSHPMNSGELVILFDPSIPGYIRSTYSRLTYDMDDFLQVSSHSYINFGSNVIFDARLNWGHFELWEDPLDPYLAPSGSLVLAVNAPPLAPTGVSDNVDIRIDMWLDDVNINGETSRYGQL